MSIQNLRPVIVGLPGAGKSTTAELIAKKYNFEVISTDKLFRVYRAISLNDNDSEGHEIMKAFFERVKKLYSEKSVSFNNSENYLELKKQAETIDDKNCCGLKDSKIFRNLSGLIKEELSLPGDDDIFRLFEIEMNKWLNSKGIFDNKLPDLSASAILYEENAELFSRKNGFVLILLDVSREILEKRLFEDFMFHVEESKKVGELKPKRGAYEIAARKEAGIEMVGEYENLTEEKLELVKIGLMKRSDKDRTDRMEVYKKRVEAVSGVVVKVELTMSSQNVFELVCNKL